MPAVAKHEVEIKSKRFEVVCATLEVRQDTCRVGEFGFDDILIPIERPPLLRLELAILDEEFLSDLASMDEFGRWLDGLFPKTKRQPHKPPSCVWCGKVYDGDETKCNACGGPKLG